MEVTVVNPAGGSYEGGGPQSRRHSALSGWAERQGLKNNEAEDFAAYYDNPSGWFGAIDRHRVSSLKKFADKHGLPFDGMMEAVENAWFGENRSHRVSALQHWANRRGIPVEVGQEMAEFVENSWYGDPQAHREAAVMSWKRRRREKGHRDNPTRGGIMPDIGELLTQQYIPEPAQEYVGIHGWSETSAPWTQGGGIILGALDTSIFAGIGELGFKDENAGTLFGFGGGIAASELLKRIGGDSGADLARGQRVGTWIITATRLIATIIRWKAGVKPSAALGAGLDDVIAKLKSGKIFDGLKAPFMAGVGFDAAVGASLGFEWPKLPALPFGLGADSNRVSFMQGYGAEERLAFNQGVGAGREARGSDAQSANSYPGMPAISSIGMAISAE